MTTQEIRAQKSAIRSRYKEIRKNCDKKSEKSSSIAQKVLSSMSYKYSKDILLYFAKDNEVETREIFEKAFSDGKNIYFPKTYSGGIMKFFKISSLDELEKANFGVMEPNGTTEEYDSSSSQMGLCIVPGICFDRNGYRIGYGKGFYDRFLSSFKGIAAGVTFSDCLVSDGIVIEKRYDKPVDIIFSESEVLVIGCK